MGTHCVFLDNCEQRLGEEDDLSSYTCDCSSICAAYNTCCVDSEFQNTIRNPIRSPDDECLQVYGRTDLFVYMIDKCKNKDIPTEILCEGNAEESNDPILMIPVTSSATGKIYKNYFCAICNENVNKDLLVFWNLQLTGKTHNINSTPMPYMLYDTSLKSWTVLDDDGSFTNVSVNIEPVRIHDVRRCKPMITTCPKEWDGVSVKEKCEGNYMARIGFYDNDKVFTRWYKNPHCAVCNFESLSKYQCKQSTHIPNMKAARLIKRHVLFQLIWTIHNCDSDQVYDNLANKCRCNARESYMRNGKCIRRTRNILGKVIKGK
ncbi:uncharacterized protein NPIL_676051 [Nephila pilipes]|uniref:SMB domain-containing protein n=1 Tax=Nephila pilipes TaxID=299642 RepID=A0A8X6UCF2_NEPPI|nr:uncharacterized protein NPIL_676051 [Nephila pilipes]